MQKKWRVSVANLAYFFSLKSATALSAVYCLLKSNKRKSMQRNVGEPKLINTINLFFYNFWSFYKFWNNVYPKSLWHKHEVLLFAVFKNSWNDMIYVYKSRTNETKWYTTLLHTKYMNLFYSYLFAIESNLNT